MTRIITIISGKGGVGKTTTVSNLGAALTELGKEVIIMDANVTTPNLSIHLGIPFYPVTLHDVLTRNVHINEAIYVHSSGIKIVPASLSVDSLRGLSLDRLETTLLHLLGKAEIIILDAAAGLGREAQAAIEVADEIIVVTNPELPAVADALKTIKIAQENGTKVLGVVVNRHKGKKHDMGLEEIQQMLEVPILGVVPEDNKVQESIANKTPVVKYSPRCKASREFKRLAAFIAGAGFEPLKERSFTERIFSWLS